MTPGRAVVAAGASGLRPAPDALAVAWSVAVLACGRMVAPRPIARRTAVPTLRLVLLRRN